MSNSRIPAINSFATADQWDEELSLLWDLMINGTTTVLVTRRSEECYELFSWIYESHKHAVALYTFLFNQNIVDSVKLQRARYFVSAFSALLGLQYPLLTIKYKRMLSNAQMLEVVNAKLSVQYTDRILGPDPINDHIHVMG